MYGKSTPILRIVSGCCARGERPRGGAAEQRNEFAPSHEHLPSRATMLGYTMSSGKHCAARQDIALTSELGHSRRTARAAGGRGMSAMPPIATELIRFAELTRW